MAGDWIKMRGNLWDDPRITRLCDLTEQSEATVIGALYWLWATADQHSQDGELPGLTARGIDRKTGVPEFAAALVAIGWLADGADGVRIVNFTDHNGTSAKRRITDATRKANVRKLSASDADIEQTEPGQIAPNVGAREKKIKKEKIETKLQAQAPLVVPDWVPKEQWDGFVAMRVKVRKPLTPRAAQLLFADLAKLRDDGHDAEKVLDQSTLNCWKGVFPIKAASGSIEAAPSMFARAI